MCVTNYIISAGRKKTLNFRRVVFLDIVQKAMNSMIYTVDLLWTLSYYFTDRTVNSSDANAKTALLCRHENDLQNCVLYPNPCRQHIT